MNELVHTLLADATGGIRIGETLFAQARNALEQKHNVTPAEVFLTTVLHTGSHIVPEVEAVINGATVVLHNVEVDLQAINKSLLTFSADAANATPITPAADTPVAANPAAAEPTSDPNTPAAA